MSMSEIVRRRIDEILTLLGENNKFVIYPFGDGGKILKEILNFEYKIKEEAIIDNFLSKSNSQIEDLSYLVNHQEVVVLISSYRSDTFEDIRKPLFSVISKEKCIEIFDRTILGLNYYPQISEMTKIYDAKKRLVRIGNEHDGGYVMADDLTGEVAYSFGIGDNPSWDLMMTQYGYDVYMYDHTISKSQLVDCCSEKMHFFKKGISDSIETDELKNLEDYLRENKHEEKENMILKMDVEGAEWGFLEKVSADTLMKFSQIVFEFHDINTLDEILKKKIVNGLHKLYLTHRVIHVHGNNWGGSISYSGRIFPDAWEVTYLRKDLVGDIKEKVVLPLAIDYPCNPSKLDISLGDWNRVPLNNNSFA